MHRGRGRTGAPPGAHGGPPGRKRSPSGSYSYSDDEPGAAWGGAVTRAPAPPGPPGPPGGGDPYGGGAAPPHYDPYNQQQAPPRYDPYGQPPPYDPYAQHQQGRKGGYPPPAPGYAPGYPPPPSNAGGPPPPPSHHDAYGAYGGGYSPYGAPPPAYGAPPGYPPPGYGAPPPGYPPHGYPPHGHPPPPGYGAPPPGYSTSRRYASQDGGRYSSHDSGRRDRSRSPPRRQRKKGQGRNTDGGGGGGEGKGGGGKKRKGDGGRRPEEGEVTENDNRPKPNLNLADVLRNVEENCKEQTASRFLQITLKEKNLQEVAAIFDAMLPFVHKLATDQFGNFVVQILLQQCTDAHREELAERLRTEAVDLSNDKFGCRVIQKALEVMTPELQQKVVADIKNNVVMCIKSMHGNHVIQACVKEMPVESLDWVVEVVEEEAEFICSHMYGCRVVQRLCERCEKYQLAGLLSKAATLVSKLARDQHGNYVVQCLLNHGRVEDKRNIMQAISANVIEYAQNKCSSNVVERCMEIAAEGPDAAALEGDRQAFLRALIGRPGDSQSPLRLLMGDKFGNFIVQKMIKHSRGEDRELLKKELEEQEPTLKNSQSGRHILTSMQKEFE